MIQIQKHTGVWFSGVMFFKTIKPTNHFIYIFKTSFKALFARTHTHIQTLQSFLASFRLGLDWSVFAFFFTIFNQIKTSQICNLH